MTLGSGFTNDPDEISKMLIPQTTLDKDMSEEVAEFEEFNAFESEIYSVSGWFKGCPTSDKCEVLFRLTNNKKPHL